MGVLWFILFNKVVEHEWLVVRITCWFEHMQWVWLTFGRRMQSAGAEAYKKSEHFPLEHKPRALVLNTSLAPRGWRLLVSTQWLISLCLQKVGNTILHPFPTRHSHSPRLHSTDGRPECLMYSQVSHSTANNPIYSSHSSELNNAGMMTKGRY